MPAARRRIRRSSGGIKLSGLAFLGFSLVVVVAGATTLVLEVRPYFVSGIAVPARMAALTSGALKPGPSFDSQRMVLDDCYVTIGSMLAKASPTSTRIRLLQQCEALIDRVVEASPSYAYAWLVAAVTAAGLENAADLNSDLTRSRQLAPNEAWLAKARFDLGEKNLASLDAVAAKGHADDIALLASSPRYVGSVVEPYIRNEAFRHRLGPILEGLSPEAQKRFIAAVNAALTAKAPDVAG